MDLDVVQDRRARAGDPLPEAGPIVHDRDPLGFSRHKSDRAVVIVVVGDDRDQWANSTPVE